MGESGGKCMENEKKSTKEHEFYGISHARGDIFTKTDTGNFSTDLKWPCFVSPSNFASSDFA